MWFRNKIVRGVLIPDFEFLNATHEWQGEKPDRMMVGVYDVKVEGYPEKLVCEVRVPEKVLKATSSKHFDMVAMLAERAALDVFDLHTGVWNPWDKEAA